MPHLIRLLPLAALMLTPLAPLPVAARQASTSAAPALDHRIAQLPDILAGKGDYDAYFADAFRQQVPQAKWAELTASITAAVGKPTGIEQVTPASPWSAAITIGYERGIATGTIAVDPAEPHQVTGFYIQGTQPRADSAAKLAAAFADLPGTAGFGIYRLGDDALQPIAESNDDRIAPLGSSFKLWVLGALSREIKSSQRNWDDVVPLEPAAFPLGTLHNWPAHSPMTLHSLATLMISQSDNTATDTLIGVVGKERVADMVRTAGVADPDATLPILTTREAFALKSRANTALLEAWKAADDPSARRGVLAKHRAVFARNADPSMFGSQPLAIDSAEWFASPADEARTLDWLRRNADPETLAILGVESGTTPDAAGRFAYIGYKGGSEPGVIAANYLVRTPDDRWFAVTGNWSDPDGAVDNNKFLGLMRRALLLAAGSS